MLARFFKPNWQHAKAEKRIKAISKLALDDPQSHSILSQLALEDGEESVRLAATERLQSLALLLKISKKDASDAVRHQALHCLSQRLLNDQTSLDDKLSALAAINDCNLLTHIVLNSHEAPLREKAISQLIDPACLQTIAEKSPRAADRVAAAQQISCPETLDKLIKHSRSSDKGVFKTAKEKLQQLREIEQQKAAEQTAISQLVTQIQQLSKQEYFPLYPAKLKSLETEWQTYAESVKSTDQEAFNSAHENCTQIISAETRKREQEAAAAQEKQQKAEQCHKIYSELCVLSEDSQSLEVTPQNVEQFQNKLKALITQWQPVSAYSCDKDHAGFDKLCAQLGNISICFTQYLDATKTLEQLCQTLASAQLSERDLNKALKQAEQLLSKLSWPKRLNKPELLQQLEPLVAAAQYQRNQHDNRTLQMQADLQTLLDELNTSISQGEIKQADKQIKRSDQLCKRLNGSLPNALELRHKQLHAELQELRDWQAYAVAPKKETLCQEMETLIESDLPLQERANRIKKVQREWKLLDATDSVHSQQLWKRFKKASDAAYAPCDQHFAEQRQTRQDNLEKREQIFTALSSLSTDTEATSATDWKAYEEQIRQAKRQWRDAAPVDRAPGKKLQVQFDQLLQQLDEPLKAFKAENAARKQALIDRTEALLAGDDLTDATEEVKQLQAQWKEIGATTRNQEQKLWNRFRNNCSEIYDRFYGGATAPRTEAITETDQETLWNDAVAICEDLEQAIIQADSTAIDSCKTAWQQRQSLTDSGLEANIRSRFSQLQQLAAQPEALEETVNAQEGKLRQLCIRMEIALSKPTPAEDQALRMEYQMQHLQQALAAQDQAPDIEMIQRIEQEWLCIPFANQYEALQQRFYAED